MKNYSERIFWWLCLSALFLFLIVARCFQFNGLYGQDAHEYLHLANSIQGYFKSGNFSQRSSFPLAYPFFGWFLSRTGMDPAFSLQLISAISFLISVIYLKRLLQYFYPQGKPGTLFIALFFILSPYLIRFSILVMSDMMAMMLILVCLFHTLQYCKRFKLWDHFLVAVSAILSIETRYACTIIIIALLAYIINSYIKKRTFPSLIQALFTLLPIIIILLGDFLIRHEFLFWKIADGKPVLSYEIGSNTWSIVHFFQDHFENADGTQQYAYWNVLQVWNNIFHPAFLFCGIVFLLFVKKEDFLQPEKKLIAITIICYALFIAGLPYQNNRYFLLTFPFVLCLLFPAFTRIANHISVIFTGSTYRWLLIFLIFAIQLSLFFFSFQSIYELNETERSIAATLKNFPNQTIYTASMSGMLESYEVKNNVIDLMQTKISTIDSNSLLLVNESYFQQHWSHQNPMINLNWIQQHAHLISLQEFPQGWTLYAIKR